LILKLVHNGAGRRQRRQHRKRLRGRRAYQRAFGLLGTTPLSLRYARSVLKCAGVKHLPGGALQGGQRRLAWPLLAHAWPAVRGAAIGCSSAIRAATTAPFDLWQQDPTAAGDQASLPAGNRPQPMPLARPDLARCTSPRSICASRHVGQLHLPWPTNPPVQAAACRTGSRSPCDAISHHRPVSQTIAEIRARRQRNRVGVWGPSTNRPKNPLRRVRDTNYRSQCLRPTGGCKARHDLMRGPTPWPFGVNRSGPGWTT